MTFKQFMEQYHGQDNPFGDLAADMKRDAAFPDADDYDAIHHHLLSCNACPECIATFWPAWKRYAIDNRNVRR